MRILSTNRALLAGCLLLGGLSSNADAHGLDVLVFTKTAGFAHPSIPAGVTALQQLGAEHHFGVTVTNDAATMIAALPAHQVVVFLNTTGDVLNAAQETSFKAWYQAGGGYLGIHAAADTEHGWPWYLDLVGAEFTNHPAIQQAQVKFLDRRHPITNVIDPSTTAKVERWTYTDEWYNFTASPRAKAHVLAVLDEDTYTGGGHGDDHPIAWCREFDGGRTAYFGMGHTDASYADPIFSGLITNAIEWAAGETNGDSGATIGSNYEKIILDSSPVSPMSLDVASDGSVYFLERAGTLKRHRQSTGVTTAIGSVSTYTGGEFGAIALALDPGFDPAIPSTQHLYLMYAVLPATATNTRISRFSLDAAGFLNPASEQVLLEFPANRPSNHGGSGHHQGGALRFAPDGNLLASIGDNTDASSYSPRNAADIMKDARKSAANSNDLRGGIVRIRPDIGNGPPAHPNYTIPAGNLFPAGTPNARPEIYTKGARNPFRFCIDPYTGWLYYGDVGPDGTSDGTAAFQGPRGHDEFNQVRGPGWFGWPYFVGNNKPYLDGAAAPWTIASLRPDLTSYFNSPAFVTGGSQAGDSALLGNPMPAWIWYGKGQTDPQFSEIGVSGSSAAMAGAVYQYAPGKNFPAYHDRTVFLMEWERKFLLEVKTDAGGNILEATRFAPNIPVARPHDMVFGDDGAMYLIEWGTNFSSGSSSDTRISKIQYTLANKTPSAVIAANITSGSLPLVVTFSSVGSSDPEDGSAVAKAWDFNGDGITDSIESNPTHVYATAGTYEAVLTVTDSDGLTHRATLTISAGNHAPQVQFLNPVALGFFDWGDDISFQVEVTDAEDGSTAGGQITASEVFFEANLGHADHQHNESQSNRLSGAVHIPRDEGHGFDNDLSYVLDAFYTDHGAPGVDPITGSAKVVLQPKITMAQTYDDSSGISLAATSDAVGGLFDVASIDHGDYLVFRQLNLQGISEIGVRASTPGGGGSIAIRRDAVDGPLLGTITAGATGSASVYRDFRTAVTDPGGNHDLYFVFENAAAPNNLMRLGWLAFRGPGASIHRQGPAIAKLEALGSTRYLIKFDQPVDFATASNPANYGVDGGAGITNVSLAPDQRSVVIILGGTTAGRYYRIALNGIEDLAGDPIMSGTKVLAVAPFSEPSGFAYGVNCGATTAAGLYVDAQGRVYYPDPHADGATNNYSITRAIAGTTDDALYQIERSSTTPLSYEVAVPYSGTYTITLKFAEIYFSSANSRKFGVAVEGATLAPVLDIFAQAGADTACDLTTTVNVTDGNLSIALSPGSANRPKLSAFYIESAGTQDNTPKQWYGVKANSTTAYASVVDGTPYLPDAWWAAPGNSVYGVTGSIAGANGDDFLYLTERYAFGNLTYDIPVRNGTYEAVLHYAEIYSAASSPGVRKFRAHIEGSVLAPDPLDLAAVAGYRTAWQQSRTVSVTDGKLTILLEQIPGFENPKISAIKLRGTPTSIPEVPDGMFTWLNGFPALAMNPDSDFDGDGFNELLEYALGGNPEGSDPDIAPELVRAGNDHDFVVTRPIGLTDVDYRICASNNLIDWTGLSPASHVEPAGAGMERIHFHNIRAAAAAAGLVDADHTFFRLEVELVPAAP